MGNEQELAKDIVEHVGGSSNIIDFRHCITRLRFHLRDEAKADTDYLKRREGIVTVVQSGGQYQVVIGNHVIDVYNDVVKVLGGSEVNEEQEEIGRKGNLIDYFIDLMSGLFQPFLGVLAASGMIKGLVAILSASGVPNTNGAFILFNAAGDAFFQFLPIMIVVTAAKKFKMNQFIALAIAGAMLYPSLLDVTKAKALYILFKGTVLEAPIHTTLFGLPLILGKGYYSTVIPIILTLAVAAQLEKMIQKRLSANLKGFMTPFIVLLITVPLAVMVLGPLATWGANLVGASFQGLNQVSPILFGLVLGALWQVLVMFGLHWGLVPLMIIEFTNTGTSSIATVINGVSFGQMGALLAMIFKSKNSQVKSMGVPAAISALFGVTEPSIYGFTLPAKLPFYSSCVAGALQGVYLGLFKVTAYTMAGLGIFSIPAYVDPSGQHGEHVWHYVVAIILATIVGFVLTYIIYKEEENLSDKEKGQENQLPVQVNEPKAQNNTDVFPSLQQEIVASPLEGKIVSLEAVPDKVFSSQAMGKGIAILPTSGEVYAPFSGKLVSMFPTGHAMILQAESGVELLIHIGLDTVQLNGKGFKKLLEDGDKIVAGHKILEFDQELIEAAGYSPVCPIVVMNSSDFTDVLMTQDGYVHVGDYLIDAVK